MSVMFFIYFFQTFNIIRFLVGLFPEAEPERHMPTVDVTEHSGGMELPEPNEPFWLWDVLMVIACIALFLWLAFLLFKASVKLIHFLQRRFGERHTQILTEESLAVFDIHEKCDMIRSVRKKESRFFGFLNPAERIRKLYRKRVLSAKILTNENALEQLSSYTARECAGKLEIPSMAKIYEKARYSKEEVTSEDVKEMKDICKA